MKRDWIKLQLDILNDPTYGLLPDDLFRRLLELNMLAGEKDQDGQLPEVESIAWRLRVDLEELLEELWRLSERGLVVETPQGWLVTGFKESQAAPNSTERSRVSRRRRLFATDPDEYGDEKWSEDADEMQRSSPYPVAGPAHVSNFDPRQPKLPAKTRHRHKTNKNPVEKPVDNIVEKGRKISDFPEPTSSSSLTNFLKTSLNLKLPLLELLEPESEKFRLSQGETLKNKRLTPGSASFTAAEKAPQDIVDQAAEKQRTTMEGTPEAVDTYPVDKSVDNFVEKGRKISDPDDIPP